MSDKTLKKTLKTLEAFKYVLRARSHEVTGDRHQ